MWLSNKRTFLAFCVATLVAACQFSPVYGPGTSASKLQDRIFIQEPGSEEHYLLVKHLEQTLGRADPAPMTLTFIYTSSIAGLGTTTTGAITRLQRTGTLIYTLKNTETDATIDSGSLVRFTGYSATGNTASALAAERASAERLVVIVGDALIDRLNLIDHEKLP